MIDHLVTVSFKYLGGGIWAVINNLESMAATATRARLPTNSTDCSRRTDAPSLVKKAPVGGETGAKGLVPLCWYPAS